MAVPQRGFALRERRPTMADVGRRAGVSATTVSFVLNGRDEGITEATRQRVRDAIAELGYRPNRAAQGLRTRRTQTVGFVTDEVAVLPPAGQTIAGAHDEAWTHGSLLLIVNTTRDPEVMGTAVHDLIDRQVDAMVLAVVGTRRVTVPVEAGRVPLVLANCFCAGDAYPCFLPDEAGGGRAAARMLLDAGHRRIAFLTGSAGSWATRARIRGARAVLGKAGVTLDPRLVRAGNFKADSGYVLARELLALPRSVRPTGVLCGNDRMATGALFAFAEAGVAVPGDVSVVGYDDQIDLAAEVHPALSSVRLPYYEMGRVATRHLLAGDVAELSRRTYLPCVPVPRASVGPPPTPPRLRATGRSGRPAATAGVADGGRTGRRGTPVPLESP
jgi:LacI family transcriptional regulator